MPDEFTIDTSEFDRAIVDLSGMPRNMLAHARQAVQVNAQHIKESWRDKLQGNPYAPRVPFSISYDTKQLAWGVSAEIGANKGTGQQGGVALLLEYGAPRKNLGARGLGLASLAENLDDLRDGVNKALAQTLREAGLS